MKQGVLVEIDNVKNARNAVDYLENRPFQEMVGLGLLYGPPGLGKSRFAKITAFQKGYIYIRLDAPTTARTFLARLYQLIMYKKELRIDFVNGSTAAILNKIIEELELHPQMIVVDEIDYAFRDKKLLGSIRDIVDHTFSIILLIGMSNAKEELMKANSHYFDRCNAFVRFNPLTLREVGIYLQAVSDVRMDQDLVSYIYKKTEGNMRNIVKELRKIEALAAKGKLKSITYRQYMEEVA